MYSRRDDHYNEPEWIQHQGTHLTTSLSIFSTKRFLLKFPTPRIKKQTLTHTARTMANGPNVELSWKKSGKTREAARCKIPHRPILPKAESTSCRRNHYNIFNATSILTRLNAAEDATTWRLFRAQDDAQPELPNLFTEHERILFWTYTLLQLYKYWYTIIAIV